MTTERLISVSDTHITIATFTGGQRTAKVVMPVEDIDPKLVAAVAALVDRLDAVDKTDLQAKHDKRGREATERKRLAAEKRAAEEAKLLSPK